MTTEAEVCCGLVHIVERENYWAPATKVPIPLISVDVAASVVHAVGQVEITQVYVNKEEQPIEAIYYFPVNPDGAVTQFQAELEGRIIKGIVKEKEDAKADYEKAVTSGRTAFLGEETKADIFKLRVGCLKPGAQVKVVIGYVTEVKNEPGSNDIRFYIPTTIAPRYVSPSETDVKAQDIKEMTFSQSSPAPLSLKVAVSLQGGIRLITSPTHGIKVGKTGPIPQNLEWAKAIVELSGNVTDMDRDFVLNIVPEEAHKPRLYSEKREDGSTAMMIHMIPSFKLDEQKTELIFVLDRSGSMSGQSIKLASQALLLFLHSMPADSYFNVVGFGSTFQFLFRKSAKYDDRSLRAAVSHAETVEADLGGTEILAPLQEIYKKPRIEGYLRQIFILTDGEVSNTDAVLGLAKANAHSTRVFCLGIGDGASHHLVEGVSKAGGGTSAFVTYYESIEKKVLNQLKNGLQPSLTEIQLEWEGFQTSPQEEKPLPGKVNKVLTLLGYNKPMRSDSVDGGVENPSSATSLYKQSPKRIPPVYDGSQMLVFGLFQSETPSAVTIKAQSPDGPLTFRIEHTEKNDVGSTNMLHALAAVKLIRELELKSASLLLFQCCGDASGADAEKLKQEIVEIAVKNSITSKFTSFVAVDLDSEDSLPEGWIMERREVPTQVAHGWHGGPRPATPQQIAAQMRFQYSQQHVDEVVDIMRTNVEKVLERDCKLSELDYRADALKCGNMMFGEQVRSLKSKASSVDRFNGLFDPLRKIINWKPGTSSGTSSLQTDSYLATSEFGSDLECSGISPETAAANSSNSSNHTKLLDEPNPLLKLTKLQSFDGSYMLDDKLSEVIGKSLEILKKAAKEHNLEEPVFATALAIVFFQNKLAAEQDVWDLIVKKARKWLTQPTRTTPDELEALLKLALTYI